MPKIPTLINGVIVDFGAGVVNEVDQSVIDGLTHCVKSNLVPDHMLTRIFISSASDQHVMPSRHAQKKAVDISRINGLKIVLGYPGDSALKAIVDAIQVTFETFSRKRENFGPHLKRKLGVPFRVGGHNDHIHLSVN